MPGYDTFSEDPYSSMFSLDGTGQQSNFLDLFNNFRSQYPDIGQYLQPNDPDLLKYQQLANKPSGSESLISDYISRRPTREDYKTSFGKKIVATLLGTLMGNPRAAVDETGEFLEKPYRNASEEWRMEGSNIGSRARLMDTERNRQLQALKYGLQTKAGTKKAEAAEGMRASAEARRLASEVAGERERAEKDRQNREHQEYMDQFRELVFGQRKSMDEFYKWNTVKDNDRADAARKASDEARAAKASDLGETNKKISAYAEQHGIDTSAQGTTVQDMVKALAFEKAMTYPFFKDAIVKTAEGYEFVDPESDKAKAATNYIKTLMEKYLRGEFN